MRAVVCHGPGDVRVEDIDDPVPQSGEVKIEVHAVGVCHTDLNFTTGQVPVPYPIVLGHEAAGVVVETMVALVLARAALEKFGGDSLTETRRNIEAYRRSVADQEPVSEVRASG